MVTGKTDATGLVSLPFVPTTTGACQVTVTHPEARPYMGAATVVPTSASFSRSPSSPWTTSRTGAGIVGNGNGRIEVGETVGIRLSLLNRGGSAATGASASLEVADDAGLAVTVLQGQDDLGTVPAGGSASASFGVGRRRGVVGCDPPPRNVEPRGDLGPAGQTHTETLTPNVSARLHPSSVRRPSRWRMRVERRDGIPEGGDTWKVAFEFLSTGEYRFWSAGRLAPAPGNGISISGDAAAPDAERFQLAASDTFEVIFS
ncbi:MAG: hypothetical protein R3E12_12730 [Candidatus Eisenbacteria bacterium]